MADMIRMTPADRRRQLLDVALDLAVKHGYRRVTRLDLAVAAGCSPGLVNVYFVTMQELRDKVMRAAIRRAGAALTLGQPCRWLAIVAEGLAEGHTDAVAAPRELQRAAAASLVVGGGE